MKVTEAYKLTFTTEAGDQVLKDLRAQFYDKPELVQLSRNDTVVAAAQRDVVRYILDMMDTAGVRSE